MNPLFRTSVLDAALAEDAARARAEYLNIPREDLSDFVPPDVVENVTNRGIYEFPPEPGVKYTAFADCAGGTGTDSFALAIARRDGLTRGAILVAVRERKPRFVPAQVIAEFAQLLKAYNITEVQGDRYAIGFHADEWRQHSIKFVECERTTSENYLSLLPLLLASRVRLLDNSTLRNQLTSLERRVGAGDRETVTHPQIASAHDDVSCAAAGALVLAAGPDKYPLVAALGYDDAPPPRPYMSFAWPAWWTLQDFRNACATDPSMRHLHEYSLAMTEYDWLQAPYEALKTHH
jgi:hypothetical protein